MCKTLLKLFLRYFSMHFQTIFKPIESQNQAKNIPVGLLSISIKIWGKSVQGVSELRLDKQTNKQTNRYYNFINIELNFILFCMKGVRLDPERTVLCLKIKFLAKI